MFYLNSLAGANLPSCDKMIKNPYYTVCYNYELKSPVVVSYALTRSGATGRDIKKRMSFRVSREIPKKYRSSSRDYKNSGYDKGHLASDASFDQTKKMLRSTYYYHNAVPMHRRVNRQYWLKAERFERLIATVREAIIVTNIVIFDDDPDRMGKSEIAIPKGFYKVIETIDGSYSRCFYYENKEKLENDKLRDHLVEIPVMMEAIKKRIPHEYIIKESDNGGTDVSTSVSE